MRSIFPVNLYLSLNIYQCLDFFSVPNTKTLDLFYIFFGLHEDAVLLFFLNGGFGHVSNVSSIAHFSFIPLCKGTLCTFNSIFQAVLFLFCF